MAIKTKFSLFLGERKEEKMGLFSFDLELLSIKHEGQHTVPPFLGDRGRTDFFYKGKVRISLHRNPLLGEEIFQEAQQAFREVTGSGRSIVLSVNMWNAGTKIVGEISLPGQHKGRKYKIFFSFPRSTSTPYSPVSVKDLPREIEATRIEAVY